MNLKRDFDVLQLQDKEDKKKIDDLMSLNKEIGRKHNSSIVSKSTTASSPKKPSSSAAPRNKKGEVPKNMKSKSVIKTVILPNEDVNRLGLESEELQPFLRDQQALFEQTARGYEKDRILREQEFRLKEVEHAENMGKWEKLYKEKDKVNYEMTKRFFDYKHHVQQRRQQLKDEQDLLKVEQETLKNQLHEAREKAEITTDHAEKIYKTKEENFQKRFRKETRVNEEDLTVVKEQYSKAQDKIIKDLQETEKKLRETMEHSELVD